MRLMASVVVAMLNGLALAGPDVSQSRPQFDIPAGALADGLDRFSEQSGLQVAYRQSLVEGVQARPVNGSMDVAAALARLLAGTGLDWEYVNRHTIVLRGTIESRSLSGKAAERGAEAARTGGTSDGVALGNIEVFADPRRVLPREASSSSFGFSLSLLDTPRSVSVISQETIDLFGLSAVEDLVRVAPGVYTTTRFGIQGSIDIRNVAADTYFRGMKRLNLQGHGRSVLAATDTIEIVRGPPSPISGMGKIGGYTNLVPKSGRAKLGGYLPRAQGFVQGIAGSYDRSEWSFGLGGPTGIVGKRGGYYVYGLFEDSDSFARQVPIRQALLQAAVSVDDVLGPFRLETGINYQLSGTAGALLNRFTQDVADSGRYLRGSPLVNLDLNGSGSIGYLEMHAGSPARGALEVSNQPLIQRWSWPLDAAGKPLPLDEFPVVAGIPQSMYDHLVAQCGGTTGTDGSCPDPTGVLRAQGVGGPLPQSGYVPAGFALDPRTVGYDTLDLRRADSFERDLEAEFVVGYLDFIYDVNPDFTVKNQLFFDSMDQYKLSAQPGGGKQDVYVLENKLTVTRRLSRLPSWLRINTLATANFRHTRSVGRRYGGDFSSHRTDVMLGDGTMTPNTTFVHPFENEDPANDGAPWTSRYETKYWEAGAGVLFDVDLFGRTRLLMGGRFDTSRAQNTDFAAFMPVAGTSAAPGGYAMADLSAHGSDDGASWNISLSHRLPHDVHPYVTLAGSSLTLEGSNNKIANDVILRSGHIGTARLREAGVKASLLADTLFVTAAAYEQTRTQVSQDDDRAVLAADVSATRTRGWEAELKWVPLGNLFVSVYALRQKTLFEPNAGANILVDARALGFQDVLDADGNVVYPAESFLYGGRAFLALPPGMAEYERKRGNPETQLGVSAQYQLAGGLGFTLSGNYFSSVCSGRLCLAELPSARVVNAGIFWDTRDWHVKLEALNAFDERYFRARTGDTLGETLVQAMPGVHWQLTVKRSF